MKLTHTTIEDTEQLTEWIQADPYHQDCLNPEWWFTGNGLLSFCIQDSKPIVYCRVDVEHPRLRLHCQFGPVSEVSRFRVVKALTWGIPVMQHLARQNNLTGLVYQSVSPSLIQFMQIKFGFVPIDNNDYLLEFREE